jgi:hypothetical protein
MKKLLSVIVFMLCAVTISAQQEVTIGGIQYSLENGQATIMAQPINPVGIV